MAFEVKDGKVNVKPVYNGEIKEAEISFDLPEEDYGFEDVVFRSPVKVTGKVTGKAQGKEKSEGYTELDITVSAEISTECARCLEPINETIEFTKIYGLTESKVSDDSEDYISTSGGELDIEECARSLFILNFPTRFLCDEDCKGLCCSCGKNLNDGECDCNKKEIDPRLAVLKNLKFD
jgi:uncharacterized protein